MMPLEVDSVRAICSKCGTDYSRQKGYFPVSYATLHKGVGHTHVCKKCIDGMYNGYLAQCHNAADAVRQVCRKLDLYWCPKVFDLVARKSTTRSMMTQYIAKVNSLTYAGKSYDDTLSEEGTLWNFGQAYTSNDISTVSQLSSDTNKVGNANTSTEEYDIPEDVVAFWGAGYTPEMLHDLEQRRSYWMSRLPEDMDVDIGTEAIIRQLCSLELDINRDRASGRSVDKNINTLNTLLGSAKLKPTQKSDDSNSAIDNTPFGVWIRRWENQRPIPEVDPELKDVDGIVKYILTWLYGHLAKMVGIKNARSKLYEQEIERLRVDHPEFEDDSDEDLLYDIFGDSNSESSQGDDP